jgi:hypothetical protein
MPQIGELAPVTAHLVAAALIVAVAVNAAVHAFVPDDIDETRP